MHGQKKINQVNYYIAIAKIALTKLRQTASYIEVKVNYLSQLSRTLAVQ